MRRRPLLDDPDDLDDDEREDDDRDEADRDDDEPDDARTARRKRPDS